MNDFEIEDLQNVIKWVKENHGWLSQSYENAIGESTSTAKGEPIAELQKLYIEVQKQLKPILMVLDENLTFEIGPGVQKSAALVLSAGGVKSCIPAVRYLVENMPHDLSIDVIAFKPAREVGQGKLIENFGGKTFEITADEVRFSLHPEAVSIGIKLYFKNYSDENLDPFARAGFHFMDFALGEYDVMTGIGEISFEKIPDDTAAYHATFAICELKDQFASEKAKLISHVNALSTLSQEERMADVNLRFSESIAQLKKRSAERTSDREEFIALRLWSRTTDLDALVRERLPQFECLTESSYSIVGEGFELSCSGAIENLKDNFGQWLNDNLMPLLLPDCFVLEIGDPGEIDLEQTVALAYMLFEAREFTQAIAVLRLALAQYDSADEELELTALNLLSVCYLDAGENEMAIKSYSKVVERTEDKIVLYDAYSNLGLACLRLSLVNDALPWLEKALAINSNKANLHHNFACAYVLIGDTEKACASIVKCLEIEPKKLQEITQDTDFDGIRNSKEFIDALAQAKKGKSLLSGVKKKLSK